MLRLNTSDHQLLRGMKIALKPEPLQFSKIPMPEPEQPIFYSAEYVNDLCRAFGVERSKVQVLRRCLNNARALACVGWLGMMAAWVCLWVFRG